MESFLDTIRFACLARGSKAVLQFYPENAQQMEMISTAAMRCGFTGGLLVDFPHSTKAKKYFLVLFTGSQSNFQMPQALGTDEESLQNQIAYGGSESSYQVLVTHNSTLLFYDKYRQTTQKSKGKKRASVKSRDWVVEKKERQRRQGREVRPDSKYTGRKRGPKYITPPFSPLLFSSLSSPSSPPL